MLLELGNGGHVCSPPHSEPIPGPCREVKKTVCGWCVCDCGYVYLAVVTVVGYGSIVVS